MGTQPLNDIRLNGTILARRLRGSCLHARPCPPHAWDCPVVMKLDPSWIAWTCASCGTIATAAVGAGPPPA